MQVGRDRCDKLAASEICIIVEKQSDGGFVRHVHTHVPRHRLSEDARYNLLRALVMRYSEADPEMIIRSYLNRRGANPAASVAFQIQVTYPEPGVIRHFCGAETPARAWAEEVIAPEKFRQRG